MLIEQMKRQGGSKAGMSSLGGLHGFQSHRALDGPNESNVALFEGVNPGEFPLYVDTDIEPRGSFWDSRGFDFSLCGPVN